MILDEQSIREYMEIHKTEYGESLSYEEAKEQAQNFINLFALIIQK